MFEINLNLFPQNKIERKYLIKTVSYSKKSIKTLGGLIIMPDYSLNEIEENSIGVCDGELFNFSIYRIS
ncbi:hypothetical protein H3N56_11810 [Cetobacterium sp. 2A]|uniref:hypothetical protein n=1 Tax=Cetobacterium sp. 2A TaxID=2754723 RepID=UPI00163BAD73|nr:hypothetical protein [Cetobacterium sp. 2A]MBC2857119.1 hypothetical protein [Cetobacterium sp. 2A]